MDWPDAGSERALLDRRTELGSQANDDKRASLISTHRGHELFGFVQRLCAEDHEARRKSGRANIFQVAERRASVRPLGLRPLAREAQ
jgi:hypothetical protein